LQVTSCNILQPPFQSIDSMSAAEEVKTEGYAAGEEPEIAPAGEDGEDGGDDGAAPDMAGLEAMMKGMGGGGEGGEGGGMGGMDMNALMAMMGKGGGKGGGGMDMASMMGGMGGGMGGKGGGKGGQDQPMDQSEKTCDKYVWSQKGEEVHIRIKLDPPATAKKDVEVKFKSYQLVAKVRGESIIDGTMGGKVEVDECTWCFTPEKDELLIMLTKIEDGADKHKEWKDLLEPQ